MELFSTCPLCIILSTDQLTAAFNEEKFMPQKLCSWTHGAQIVWFEQNTHHSLISSCHRIFTGWLKLKIETDSSSILAMFNLRGGGGAIPTLSLVDKEHERGFRRGHARDQHDHHQDLRHPHPLIFPAIVLSDSQLFLLSGHILFQEPLKQICC